MAGNVENLRPKSDEKSCWDDVKSCAADVASCRSEKNGLAVFPNSVIFDSQKTRGKEIFL
jgi:hypothetical protein